MTVTISDIAKEAEVSCATVSRVLNESGYVKEETRERVNKAIKDMNYTPSAIARSLSKCETNTIGVIVPDITNSYFGEIIKGISVIAEKHNLNIILFNTDNKLKKELKALNLLKEQRIKGIIMTPGFGEEIASDIYKETIDKLNVPIVLVAADMKFANLSGVFVDNLKGGYDAASILIKEGHNKIAVMSGILSAEPSMDRINGYKKALMENNIPIKEEYILNGEFSLEKSYELTKEIMNSDDHPTAIITCSNRMTMGVIKALKEMKKSIPDDLAIIGFNKINFLDIFGAGITYIEDLPEDLGEKAMEMLFDIINKNITEVKRLTVSSQLVSKGSERKV